MQFPIALRNTRLSAVATYIGSGATAKVYTGTSPGVTNAATGTLLSTLTNLACGTPAGTMTITATADPSDAASGTPGYVRVTPTTGTPIDFTAGVGSGEWNFTGTVPAGGTDTLTSCTITEGNA